MHNVTNLPVCINNDLINAVNSLTIPFLTDATLGSLLFWFGNSIKLSYNKTERCKMIDRLPLYIKPALFFSILSGFLCGILLLIPVVQLFMIFAFWIIGGVIVYMLKKNNFVGQFGQREGIIIGCVSGMVSVVAASVVFLPLSMLVGAIFKTASVSFIFATSVFSSIFSVFVIAMLVFFVGLVNIIFNIASALLVIGIYNSLEKNNEEPQEFKIEL